MAAELIPWPYTGLKLEIASPIAEVVERARVQPLGEGEEASAIRRGTVSEAACEAQMPEPSLDLAQDRPIRVIRRRAEAVQLSLSSFGTAAQAELHRRVREVDADRGLVGRHEAILREPAWHS
jgi:hypothetical protein